MKFTFTYLLKAMCNDKVFLYQRTGHSQSTMNSYPAQGFLAKTYPVIVDTVEISRGNRLGTVQDRAQWPGFRIVSPKAHKIFNRHQVMDRPMAGISLLGAGVAPSQFRYKHSGRFNVALSQEHRGQVWLIALACVSGISSVLCVCVHYNWYNI